MSASGRVAWVVCLLLALACQSRPRRSENTATASAVVHTVPSARVTPSAAASGAAAAASATVSTVAESRLEFRRWVEQLSEPDAEFISDNYVSNETSYLEVAPLLAGRTKGGVYLGVGPEQNFSYIALARPELAFIVDIRRANLLLHLLYKAAFDLAQSRSAFLALVLGRDWDAATDPGDRANIDGVLAHATSRPATEPSFARAHAALWTKIESFGLSLSPKDRKEIRRAHRTWFESQLDVAFRLKGKSVHVYPTLAKLLRTASTVGRVGSFLATSDGFRFVQELERRDRVVPVVGDLSGKRALPRLARELETMRLSVGVFYVSNVEQYLLRPVTSWESWLSNLLGLPWQKDGLVIRAYLDQGKAHPLALPGHRTTSVAQSIGMIREQQAKAPATSLWQLTTEGVLPNRP